MKDSVKYGILNSMWYCFLLYFFWFAFVGLGLGIRTLKAGEEKILGILGMIVSGITGCLYFGLIALFSYLSNN